MGIEEAIKSEVVGERLRIVWDGVKIVAVPDVTIKEIDGVIERLELLKRKLNEPFILMTAAPGKIIKP